MTPEQINLVLKRFDDPDEVRTMEKGRFELVRIGGMTIGRAIYEPGWKWSEHVGPSRGLRMCPVEHVGTLFYIPPTPHDSWVVGDEPYISLHFLGADEYAR